MNKKATLDLGTLSVTSFDTSTDDRDVQANAAATLATSLACCGGCNTRLTCSTNLC
jgi:hypothetical protein